MFRVVFAAVLLGLYLVSGLSALCGAMLGVSVLQHHVSSSFAYRFLVRSYVVFTRFSRDSLLWTPPPTNDIKFSCDFHWLNLFLVMLPQCLEVTLFYAFAPWFSVSRSHVSFYPVLFLCLPSNTWCVRRMLQSRVQWANKTRVFFFWEFRGFALNSISCDRIFDTSVCCSRALRGVGVVTQCLAFGFWFLSSVLHSNRSIHTCICAANALSPP